MSLLQFIAGSKIDRMSLYQCSFIENWKTRSLTAELVWKLKYGHFNSVAGLKIKRLYLNSAAGLKIKRLSLNSAAGLKFKILL